MISGLFMIASSSVPPTLTRLPVSWREFSELLQQRTKESSQSPSDPTVQPVVGSRLDIRSDSSSTLNDQRFFSKSQFRPAPDRGKEVGYPADNPCDSPHEDAEYPDGIDVWA